LIVISIFEDDSSKLQVTKHQARTHSIAEPPKCKESVPEIITQYFTNSNRRNSQSNTETPKAKVTANEGARRNTPIQKVENLNGNVQKQETKKSNEKDETLLRSPLSRSQQRLQSCVESPKGTKDTKPETATSAVSKSPSTTKFPKLKALNAILLKSENEKRAPPQSAPKSPVKKVELNVVASTSEESEEPECGCAHFSPTKSSNRRVLKFFKAKIDDKLVDYMKEKSKQWEKYPDQLVDTHCHFDMLFTK
jgi:hypothetical protein